VDGTVANSVTGAPIVRAQVVVRGIGSTAADSDANGTWSAENLSCGTVTIEASRQNFLPDKPSQPQTVLLAPGIALHDVKIRLAPQAVITGRVVDNQGDPAQNVPIMLMASRVLDGVRRFQIPGTASTNDIGEYRIAGIAAGKYVICAGGRVTGPRNNPVRSADSKSYGQQCSPGSPYSGVASTLEIRAGYERAMDFQLTPLAPPSTRHVRGAIAGGPDVGRQITLSGLSGTFTAGALDDGTFDITDVLSGSYSLTATAFQDDTRYFAALPVDVGNADIAGLQMRLEAGLNVAGIVRITSASGTKIENPQYSASLISSNMFGPAPTRTDWADDKASFTLTNVMPGTYRLRFAAPAPFYLKSATLGGLDIAGSEVAIGSGAGTIEVILSDDCGVLQGGVAVDDAPTAASILVLKDATQHWNGHADASGHFKIEGLPPGDYTAYAWDDITNVEYGNPEWMWLHAKGVSLTIQPGQTTQAKLSRQVAPDE
jgi:hypothetical protein